MFEEGNLVVLTGQDEVMRVVHDSDAESGVTVVEKLEPDSDDTAIQEFDTGDLSLVTDEQVKEEVHHPVGAHVNREPSEVQQDIAVLMVQVYNWMRDQGVDGNINIEVCTSGYNSDTELDVTFEVSKSHDKKLKGNDLWMVAQAFVSRYHEDARMKPLQIPRYT